MKEKVKCISIIVAIFIMISFMLPFITHYAKFTNESYYIYDEEKLTFSEVFYEPKNNESEIYGIGLFDCLAADELKEDPSLITYYNDMETRTFEAETIVDLFDLLRKCSFSPIKKSDSYNILCQANEQNAITSIHISLDLFLKGSPYFSETLLEKVNEQIVGVTDATIYSINDKIYLIANMASFVIYSEYYGYEMPDFTDTSKCVFEIEQSEALTEIIERKDDFYVYEPDFYEETPINIINLVVGVIAVTFYILYKKVKTRDGSKPR